MYKAKKSVIKKGSNNLEEIVDQFKNKVEYIKLKSLSSDEDLIQYNFWFDIDKKEFSSFIKKGKFRCQSCLENKHIKIMKNW